MEWLWKLIENFQKSVALSAVRSFTPTDWILVFAILWGLLQGSRKGFSDMFGKLLGIFLISMLTMSFYKKGAYFLSVNLSVLSPEAADAFSFFFTSIFSWLSISWCIKAFGKVFQLEAKGVLKTLGGMVFGGLRMVLLLGFFAQILLFVIPIAPVKDLFKPGRSYAGYTISRIVPDLHKWVLSPFSKSVSKKSLGSGKAGG